MELRVLWFCAFFLVGCGAKTGLRVPRYDADVPRDARVACVPGSFPLAPATSTLVFVIDRSGSMKFGIDPTERVPPERRRWALLREALRGAFTELTPRVRVGAKFFPIPGSEVDLAERLCMTAPGIDIAPRVGGQVSILDIFDSTQPAGPTPTAGALDEAVAALRGVRGRRFLVLATDGGPNCNDRLDARTCVCTYANVDPDPLFSLCRVNLDALACLDDARSIEAVRRARLEDIPVYVVGIEDPIRPDFSDVLDQMADEGGRPRGVPGERRFYSVTSETALSEALSSITASIAQCGFTTPSAPTSDEGLRIEIDGVPFALDPSGARGFRWTDRAQGELELAADACAAARRAGAQPVGVVDRCVL